MEDMVVKYAFTYGPLMIFFFAVGWGLQKYAPPLFAAWQAMMRETVSALQSASIALNNSTNAIQANSDAMTKHHETVMIMNRFWEDMRTRLDDFECPAASNRKRVTRKPQVRIVSDQKN